jgi:hypothetical protein
MGTAFAVPRIHSLRLFHSYDLLPSAAIAVEGSVSVSAPFDSLPLAQGRLKTKAMPFHRSATVCAELPSPQPGAV